MKEFITKYWFRPYTPIIIIIIITVITVIIIRFVVPAIEKALKPATVAPPTDLTTPTPPFEVTVVNQLSKLMVLPSDETPQVITITDIDKFKNQPFFKDAKNQDLLVLYAKNKKAILFDPKANKILNTAPISLATESATSN